MRPHPLHPHILRNCLRSDDYYPLILSFFSRLVIGVKSMQVYDFEPLELVSLGISQHELIEIL